MSMSKGEKGAAKTIMQHVDGEVSGHQVSRGLGVGGGTARGFQEMVSPKQISCRSRTGQGVKFITPRGSWVRGFPAARVEASDARGLPPRGLRQATCGVPAVRIEANNAIVPPSGWRQQTRGDKDTMSMSGFDFINVATHGLDKVHSQEVT